MYVIALRVEAVLRNAGSYDINPSWRRSVARIVPSAIGISTSFPVRLSRIVSVSSATARTLVARPVVCSSTSAEPATRKYDSKRRKTWGSNSLKDVLQEQLEDLHSAETQLIEALPKMAQAAHHDELQQAFEHHLEETRGHLKRVEEALGELGVSHPDRGVQGDAGPDRRGRGDDRDERRPDRRRTPRLIAAAQRVEHYEIAAYGTARQLADDCGYDGIRI